MAGWLRPFPTDKEAFVERSGAADKPTGREEVVEALLDAADQMFATRSPSDVSLRAIARDANVNHGLVYRHFGTRDDVIDRLLARMSERWTAQIDASGDPFEAIGAILGPAGDAAEGAGSWLRLLAWSLLANVPGAPTDPQQRYSTLDRIPPLLEADDPERAAIAVGAALSLVFGWRFFHPYLRPALHLDDIAFERLQGAMADAVRLILEAAAPAEPPPNLPVRRRAT